MRNFRVRVFNTVEPVTTFYQDLIPYWRSLGWQVDVIISNTEYRTGRGQRWQEESLQIHRTPSLGLNPTKRWAKVPIMVLYIVTAALLSLFGPRIDRNLFLTQPPLFYVWGLLLKKLRRQPYIIVLMDLYPDVAIRDGLLPERSAIAAFLYWLSRLGLKHADGVIVIGRCMAERVIEIGVHPERVHFIPNWTNQETIVPIQSTENIFRQEMGWQDKFVILYSGNIGVSHYFADLLEVSRRLQKQVELIFVFIGHGSRRKEIEQFILKHSSTNIVLLPFQPENTLAQSLGAGDLHFVSLRTEFTGLVVPSKTYGVMAAGRAVVFQGSSDGEIARMIKDEGIGCVVPIDHVDELEQAILHYLKNKALAVEQGRRARQVLEHKYNNHLACQKYTTILQNGSAASNKA